MLQTFTSIGGSLSMEFGKSVYEQLVSYWTKPAREDVRGVVKDLEFVERADWVETAAMIDHIRFYEGQWHVNLIYAHPDRSNTFVIRKISSHTTYESARFNARVMRSRGANLRINAQGYASLVQFHKN